MDRSTVIIAKWLLAIECLTCFAPLTALWLVAISRINQFIDEPVILFRIAITTIAPVSMSLALSYVFLGWRPHYKTHITLAIAFVVLGAMLFVGMTFVGPHSERGPTLLWSQIDWSLLALFSAMPALCSWHLAQYANPRHAELKTG